MNNFGEALKTDLFYLQYPDCGEEMGSPFCPKWRSLELIPYLLEYSLATTGFQQLRLCKTVPMVFLEASWTCEKRKKKSMRRVFSEKDFFTQSKYEFYLNI